MNIKDLFPRCNWTTEGWSYGWEEKLRYWDDKHTKIKLVLDDVSVINRDSFLRTGMRIRSISGLIWLILCRIGNPDWWQFILASNVLGLLMSRRRQTMWRLPKESHVRKEEDGAGAVNQGQQEHKHEQQRRPFSVQYLNKEWSAFRCHSYVGPC